MFIAQLQEYFNNERLGARIGFLIGVVLLVLWFFLRKRTKDNPVLKGFLFPLLFLSIFGTASIFNVYNNTKRSGMFTAEYLYDPSGLITKELARMENVDTWWLPLNIAWATITVIGLLLFFLNKKNLRKGIGAGLILIGITGFIVDSFGHKNADHYLKALRTEKANSKIPE